jgi:hypothetical protein
MVSPVPGRCDRSLHCERDADSGAGAWVRPAVIFEVVDRLLLLTGHPAAELTPARTNVSFFNCLQQRNQTFQR